MMKNHFHGVTIQIHHVIFSIVLYYTIRLFNINRQHKPSIALEFGTSGINLTLAFLKIILFRVISQLEFYKNSALEIGIYCRLLNEQF